MRQLVAYTVRRLRRAKNIRITVRNDGSVHVSAPIRATARVIEQCITSKAAWIATAQAHQQAHPRPHVGTGTREEYMRCKKQALQLAEERLQFFNRHYGLTWTRVSIRNQRTRWGSCSRAGALAFNYRIALLPPELVDYLVVHELCHRQEMSHGPRFWALVGETVPDWRKLRGVLRKML